MKEVPLEAPTENAVTEDVSAPITRRVNFIFENIHLKLDVILKIFVKSNNGGNMEVVNSFLRSAVQIRNSCSSTWRKRVPRVITLVRSV